MPDRFGEVASWPLRAASAVLASTTHKAILPKLSCNDVYVLWGALAAAGSAQVLTSPLGSLTLLGDGAAAAFGTMCALHTRSRTGLILVTGICLVAIPAARAMNLIER